jgi:hypothetical protein
VTEPEPPRSDGYDAREGSGDPATDPAAVGERSFEQPDADGGAVPAAPDATAPDS